ncbi:ArnT family glycosyltransferase [Acidobacteriota bacterium]
MRGQTKIPWLVILCAIFVFLFTNLISYFIFNHTPHINDEVSYLFQAKIFKSGRLFAPSPAAKNFFNFPHVINNGQWYSHYPPAYPIILLFGLLIGAPWIINPLLAALSIVFFYLLGKEVFSKQVGILAACLGAVSIWFLIMSSTMMSHTAGLFLITFFLLFFFRSLKKPSVLNGLLAGIGLGGAILIRPYNAFLIALPFLIFWVVKTLRNFRLHWKNTLAFGLMLILSLSTLLVYNSLTNGDPLLMGYTVRYGADHGIGFGKAGYTESAHSPYLGVQYTIENMKAMNKDLFGWPFSSFLALIPLFFISQKRRLIQQSLGLFFSSFAVLTFGLFIYWGSFILIGARMFFEFIPVFIILSALGIRELIPLLSQRLKKRSPQWTKKVVTVVLCIFTAYAFAVRLPGWIWPEETNWYYDGFANNFAGVNPSIPEIVESAVKSPSLVILNFIYSPFDDFPNYWWGSGFMKNDPDLKERVIYAQSQRDKNIEIFQHYADRKLYLYTGTLEKGMLLPIKKSDDRILYGEPIQKIEYKKKHLELITDPLDFHTLYSAEFENFLTKIYSNFDLLEINVEFFFDTGNEFFENEQYKLAAMCMEAALQIEKSPEKRTQFFNHLVHAYAKAGQRQDSIKILDKLHHPKGPKLYDIFPEKGF